ncbi:CU044_5270 family protein [Streptomyces sp. NPDC059651]|uniref:CU044_5270 family protein n=1 Tax=Streptomyces sp. NPDC059651 TaxID=3346897 RepID=UPI0036B8E10A
MNDATPPRSLPESAGRNGSAEAVRLARMLPSPAEWDLPPGRHLHHKEALMQQIDHDRASSTPTPAPPARRRLLRPALLAPLTALALAGALTVGLAPWDGGGAVDRARVQTPGGSRQHPVALLDRLSAVALASDAQPVEDSQFVYVKSIGRGADLTSGKAVTGPLKGREVWFSQVRGPVKRLGLIREDGESLPVNAELGDTGGTPAGIGRPTYRWLAALPTDRDALLAYLYARTPATDGQEQDQAVFDRIGDLIAEQVMPPGTAAALYRAAAAVPGVTEVPDATDALGRHGLGIARTDTRYRTRSEWVFAEHGLTFLGSRTFLAEETPAGPAGTLLSSRAVLQQAVVDREGAQPTRAQLRTASGRPDAEES